MDRSRWENVLTLDREYGTGRDRLAGRPLEAYIEVAARCNLRCPMCPITVDPRYQPGSGLPGLLAPEIFDRLAPLFPTLNRAYVFGLGEPALHPRLPDFVRRLSGAGVEVRITTNATLIDEALAGELARAGLDHAAVSIDGATPATYESIRRRGRFADVIRGIEALVAARERYGRPRVFLNTVLMAANLHEMTRMVELGAEIGVDGLFAEQLYPFAHPDIVAFWERENLGVLDPEQVREELERARRRAEEKGLFWRTRLDEQALDRPRQPVRAAGAEPAAGGDSDREGPRIPWVCSEPYATINVNASGEVRTCCFNNDILGRLSEQSIEEIWNGAGYAGLRRTMACGGVPGSCSGCVANGRVKRSPYLSPRNFAPAAGMEVPGLRLDLPADGDLIGDPLVLVGRGGPRSWLPRWLARKELPEVYIDDTRIASLSGAAVMDGEWFAAVIPVPFLTAGGHRLSLRPPGAAESAGWGQRWFQARGSGGAAAGFSRMAVPVPLTRREPAPALTLAGRPHPMRRWLCGPRPADGHWLGVAVIEVADLAPGAYDLEMSFRAHPPHRAIVERLSYS